MSRRPNFLTSPGTWLRAPRVDQTRAEYANPVTRYEHERSWRVNDRFMAGLLLGVVLALSLGLIGCGGGDETDVTIGPVDCRAHPELCQ